MMLKTQSSLAIALALAATSVLTAQAAQADDFIKGGQETFSFNLGGITNTFDSSVRLDGASRGTEYNLEKGGLKDNLSSFMASGTWRITERNRIDALYFGVKRSASHTTTRNITVDDQTIPAGSTVSTEAKTDYLFFDYRYSFYKSDAWEFAGVLGLYGGKFDFTVAGPGVVLGSPVNVSESTTVPLPLIGVSADWYIQPQWKVSSLLSGMQAKVGDVDGRVNVFTISTDYMITRNLGLGAAYLYSEINVDVSKSGFNGNVNFKNNAGLLYATLRF
jgi:hypothetical protein